MNPTQTCYDSPALQHQSEFYPARFRGRVPKTVLMAKTVTADALVLLALPKEYQGLVAVKDQRYPVWVNSHGAVSAIMADGRHLGLKPDEFDVVEWHERPCCKRCGEVLRDVAMMNATLCGLCADDERNGQLTQPQR